jgi:hypothetical protein
MLFLGYARSNFDWPEDIDKMWRISAILFIKLFALKPFM